MLFLSGFRNQIKADVKGTLAAVAKAGYKQVEAYGFDGKASDMMLAAKDNGMAVNSTHFAWESVTNPTKKGVPSFESILEGASDVGLTHLVIPTRKINNINILFVASCHCLLQLGGVSLMIEVLHNLP